MEQKPTGLKIEKLLLAAMLLVSLCYLAVFSIINFIGFEQFCVPDMYADTLVARLMWEEKTLFPRGFVFGNQLYVIATPVLAALFYGLGASQNTAMALATAAMSIFILLSFCWMLRPFVKSRLSLAAAMLMLLSCVFGTRLVEQETGQLFFTMCSFYACYTVTLFVVLGDYIRAVKSNRIRPLALMLSLLLSFATGMQSLRQTCIMILPLLCFEFLRIIYCRIKLRQAVSLSIASPSFRSLMYTIFNLGGCLFVKLLDVHQYTIFETPSQSLSQRFTELLTALRDISGLSWVGGGEPFFILMFLFQLAILLYTLYLLLRKRVSQGLSCLWWLLALSIAAVGAAGIFTSVSIRNIYLFIYYPLLAISAAVVLEHCGARLKLVLPLALCLLASANIYFSYGSSLEQSIEQPDSPHAQMSRWAVDNGYELVYGAHAFSAPQVAMHSDGALISGSWNDEIMFKAQEYINLQHIYSLEDVERAVFVFKYWEMDYAREAAMNAEAELTVVGRYGDYYLCTSDVQLMYPRTYPWSPWLKNPEPRPEF